MSFRTRKVIRATGLIVRHSTASTWRGMINLIMAIFIMTLFLLAPMIYHRVMKTNVYVWPTSMSRDLSDYIPASNGSSLPVITPKSICNGNKASSSALHLIVIVCSAIDNFEERKTIREAWARPDLTPDSFRVVFLVGNSFNVTTQNRVALEAANFDDVIQEDFTDSYANLTLKSLHMLKWFTSNCDSIPFMLKADDDMYINLQVLETLTSSSSSKRVSAGGGDLLMGSLICGAVPIRDPYNKWYCPDYMYSDKVYPNYLSGTSYLMSNSVARKLMAVAVTTPMLHLEDIYISGILAKKAGVRPEDHVTFSYLKRPLSKCVYSQIVTSHHLKASEMMSIANQLSARDLKCKKLGKKQLRPYGPGKCKW